MRNNDFESENSEQELIDDRIENVLTMLKKAIIFQHYVQCSE